MPFCLSNKLLIKKVKRMKKLTSLFILMIFGSSILFAQMTTREQIESQGRVTITDVDPAARVNSHHSPFVTDDLFDHQFDFICGDASGEAGVETNGEYIYTSKWNGDGFFCYEMDGTFLGAFPVPGESAVRDLAYDGTYFYGAAASTALYEMDFVGQSGTLISTLTAAVATRACAYDAEFDAFWGNNWSDPITLYDRTGGILNQFNCGAYESYYGFAWLNDAGTSWLYGFAQAGGTSQAVIVQIDPYTGAETGVTFDAIVYSSTGTGIAGGLASFDSYAPGWWTLLGIIQNETIFGVEGGIAGPPPDLDLALKGILEPNSGFGLGVEDIVFRVKNQGAITQSNFDVQYRVDGGAWVTETISGPLAQGESIDYTFSTPYDFSAFGVYFIEGEVILAGDEHPENNSGDKEIENMDPSQFCLYSITMWDDYGDGWNGGYVQIFGDGVEFVNATLASGAGPETVEFLVQDGSFLTAVWTAGGWPYECSYAIYDMDGELIFEDGMGGVDPVGGDIDYASCTPPPPIDAGVTAILSPVSGLGLGVEAVTIIAKNFGLDPLAEVPVGFNLDATGWVNEIVPGPVAPGEEVEYTFTATVDLTEIGTYFLEACTFVPDDEDPLNDCTDVEVVNIDPTDDFTYDFEGSDYADCGVIPLSGSAVTIEAWVNVDEFQANFPFISTIAGTENGTNDLCLLRIGDDGLANDKPQFIITIGGSAKKLNANTSLLANTWHHVAATYDGSIMKLYIDGVEDASLTQSGDFVSNDNFNISYSYDGRYIDGSIDELRVWNIARTESEIMEYSCNIPDPMNEPGLLAYYKFNLPGDIVLLDETGNYDALIVNQTGLFEESDACPGDYYSATFHVTSDGVNLEGAEITIGVMTKFTDINGEAVFALVDGDYNYIVTYEGLIDVQGSFTIAGEDITIEVEMLGPHFEFEGGDPSSPLWTIYIAGAMINGEDLVADDQIAIFDGDLMVGLFTLNQVCTPENQFENDLTAFSVLVSGPGYQAGNSYFFKCWDASEDLVVENFEIELFDPYGDAYTGDVFPSGDGDYSIIALDFIQSGASQTFDLSTGFQFISSSVIPDDPDMLAVMADILNENLDFARNSQGQTLRKIGPNWVNGIGDWIIDEGYLVKMFADDSFTIMGVPVNPSTPIPVAFGFQFVSYFPDAPINALDAFATIIGDDLDFIRNSQGQTLRKIGPNWVNGIGDCQPGEGYLVKMFADGEIIYPASAKSSGKTTIPPVNFIFEGGNPAEAVYTLYLEGLEIDDEVAAYDGDKMIGAVRINSENAFENELPVFSSLVNGQGYEVGNPITLKVWSENNIVSADFTMEAIYDSYVSDVYPDDDGKYSVVNITKGSLHEAEEIISVYPNPATNKITIQSLTEIEGIVITNCLGQVMYNELHNNSIININTESFDTGIYLIRIESENSVYNKKIIIE